MITNAEKIQVKRILQDQGWPAVKKVADEIIANTESRHVVKDNEWDTIRATIEREARVQGIRDFIDALYQTSL